MTSRSSMHRRSFEGHMLSPIPEHTASKYDGGENARIRVVVRVRPLNSKERARGNKMIIQNDSEQTVTVWDPAAYDSRSAGDGLTLDPKCWAKQFSFDKILWSANPYDPGYADQNTVFEMLGQPVIDWIIEGFNCCVLAYGQTGTGKTYTMSGDMRGDPKEYGLVPRICFGLFDQLEAQYAEGDDVIVNFSHMEIYNENVRDLLAPASNGYLRVREHPQHGVFVSNLTTVRVTNFEDVMSLIAIGDKNRTVASTNSNTHSSRSHAIVTISVVQRKRNAPKHGLPTSALQQKIGRVHMVDLAGSERVTFSGAKGERLREANHINQSLSVLGDVIKSLGESKGGKRGHIPYRNSTLTLVLKESLGGNSHAVMVAGVSPSIMDYEETISTLKYADRAKRVRMHVAANITSGLLATDASAVELVPLLQAEVRKLREMLHAQQLMQQAQQNPITNSWDGSLRSDEQTSAVLMEMKERVRELEDQLAERERLIESLEVLRTEQNDQSLLAEGSKDVTSSDAIVQFKKSLSDSISSLANSSSVSNAQVSSAPMVVLADDGVDTSLPRVINLNQDPLFSECLVYYLPEGTVVAGSKSAHSDILLSGPDIIDRHCVLYQRGGSVWLLPLSGSLVFVNGDLVSPATQAEISSFIANSNKSTNAFGKMLKNFDRIAFGRFHLFRFEASGQAGVPTSPNRSLNRSTNRNLTSNRPSNEEMPPNWEFAQEELLRKNDSLMTLRSSHELPATVLSSHSSPAQANRSGFNSTAPSASKISNLTSSPKNSLAPTEAALSMPKKSVSPLHLRPTHQSTDKQQQTVVIPSMPYKAAGTAKASEPIGNDAATEKEYWERLSKIADGTEQAKPNEIKDMLRNLVGRAEASTSAPLSARSSERSSLLATPQSWANQAAQQASISPKYSPAYEVKSQTQTNKASLHVPAASMPNNSRDKSPPPPPPPPLPDSAGPKTPEVGVDLSPHEVFAREALALQQELAGMQKTLEERMQRYQKLISSGLPANK